MELSLPGGPLEETLAAEYERGLAAIVGVRGARVTLDPAGDVIEVHVVISPKRSPKKVVRDIETYFAVCHRRRVDYRRISCLQLNEEIPLQERPKLLRVVCDGHECEVVLGDGSHVLYGRAPAKEDPLHAPAAATVSALNGLWSGRSSLALVEVQRVTLARRELALVYLTYSGRTVEHLTGTSFIRGTPQDAAARAALSAVNRRLPAWLSERASAGDRTLVAVGA